MELTLPSATEVTTISDCHLSSLHRHAPFLMRIRREGRPPGLPRPTSASLRGPLAAASTPLPIDVGQYPAISGDKQR